MHHDIQLFAEYAVTPFVGVWIETFWEKIKSWVGKVTPFVGVWIETSTDKSRFFVVSSHPSWVCGLKLEGLLYCGRTFFESHPSWVCGLKHCRSSHWQCFMWSHPSWVCGLKPALVGNEAISKQSHPSWVCGLKHINEWQTPLLGGHTLRGCVD